MKKYILLLCLLFPIMVNAAYWGDNFEGWTQSSIGPWAAKVLEAACDVTTTTMHAKAGSYSLKCDDFGTRYTAAVYKTLNNNTTYYSRFYVYFPTTYFSTFSANEFGGCFLITASTGSPTAYNKVLIQLSSGKDTDGNNKLQIRTVGNDYSGEYVLSNDIVTEDNWYCVEVMAPYASAIRNSKAQWWIDGVEQSSSTMNLMDNNNKWYKVQPGLYNTSPLKPNYQRIIYVDEFVCDYNYIGPLVNKIRRQPRIIED